MPIIPTLNERENIAALVSRMRASAPLCEFPIVFTERKNDRSKFSLEIMLEGVAFPLRAVRRRIASG
jgi:hypothetical protein